MPGAEQIHRPRPALAPTRTDNSAHAMPRPPHRIGRISPTQTAVERSNPACRRATSRLLASTSTTTPLRTTDVACEEQAPDPRSLPSPHPPFGLQTTRLRLVQPASTRPAATFAFRPRDPWLHPALPTRPDLRVAHAGDPAQSALLCAQ